MKKIIIIVTMLVIGLGVYFQVSTIKRLNRYETIINNQGRLIQVLGAYLNQISQGGLDQYLQSINQQNNGTTN